MVWSEIRKVYPNQWLVIEALEAHTTLENQRELDRIAVVEQCSDGNNALEICHQLHKQHPSREFYFVHTTREQLDIRERKWLGVRR